MRPAAAAARIRTRSIYAPPSSHDGHRVLVMRHHPRGVPKTAYDEWCRYLAPSADLLRQYRAGRVQWPKFAYFYQLEMVLSADHVERLRREAERRPVTLLCAEAEGVPCHRHILKRLILAAAEGAA